MKRIYFTIVLLIVRHTIVSIFVYQFFSTIVKAPNVTHNSIEITTYEQHERGEATFMLTNSKTVTKSIPTAVIFYVCSGYIGIVTAFVIALCFRRNLTGQP